MQLVLHFSLLLLTVEALISVHTLFTCSETMSQEIVQNMLVLQDCSVFMRLEVFIFCGSEPSKCEVLFIPHIKVKLHWKPYATYNMFRTLHNEFTDHQGFKFRNLEFKSRINELPIKTMYLFYDFPHFLNLQTELQLPSSQLSMIWISQQHLSLEVSYKLCVLCIKCIIGRSCLSVHPTMLHLWKY